MQHSRAQTLRSCAFKSNCVVNVTQSVPRPGSPCVCLRRRPNNLLPGKAQSDLVRPSKREKRRRGEGQPDAIPRAVYAVCGFLPHPPLRTKLETSARSGSWIQQPLPFYFFLSFFLSLSFSSDHFFRDLFCLDDASIVNWRSCLFVRPTIVVKKVSQCVQ